MSCDKSKCEQQEGCGCEASKGSCCGTVRLHYFNARGRAELIRWVLTHGKADWEDVRFSAEEWKDLRPKMPYGQVPILEWKDKDGKTCFLTQSATIVRSAAFMTGLAGKSPCEVSQADEVYEIIRELAEAGFHAAFEQDATRKEASMKRLVDETIPRGFEFLEKKLQTNGGKHIAGGECYTYGDLAIACYVNNLKLFQIFNDEDCKKKTPAIHALVHAVENLPEIKAHLTKRPATLM